MYPVSVSWSISLPSLPHLPPPPAPCYRLWCCMMMGVRDIVFITTHTHARWYMCMMPYRITTIVTDGLSLVEVCSRIPLFVFWWTDLCAPEAVSRLSGLPFFSFWVVQKCRLCRMAYSLRVVRFQRTRSASEGYFYFQTDDQQYVYVSVCILNVWSGSRRLKALTHQAVAKELMDMKPDCCVAMPIWAWKSHLNPLAQTATGGPQEITRPIAAGCLYTSLKAEDYGYTNGPACQGLKAHNCTLRLATMTGHVQTAAAGKLPSKHMWNLPSACFQCSIVGSIVPSCTS